MGHFAPFFKGYSYGGFDMVSRWLLFIALSFQVTFAVAVERTDYRNWTPEQQQKVINRYDNQFSSVKKDIEFARKFASGELNSLVKSTNQVSTQLRDSAVDPDTGRKIKIEANVTQTANKSRVAEALMGRLKNAKDYAKNVGKASIPTFVGMAAFHGLMEGIDWVMDEGGKITKKSDPNDAPDPNYQWRLGNTLYNSAYSACNAYWSGVGYGWVLYSVSKADSDNPVCTGYNSQKNKYDSYQPIQRVARTTPVEPQESQEVPTSEIQAALITALSANNAEQAKLIAQAIKDAYTPDTTPGQNLSDKTTNGLAIDASDLARNAVNQAAQATGSEATADGKQGYYKITDGEKTVEGYIYPSDSTATGLTDSTTVTNSDGSTTTTGTMSQEWPFFCDWAGTVCEFIDWVREDEEIEDPEEEEIDDSLFDREIEFEVKASRQCPPNPIWQFDFINQHWSKEIDITMVCDFFSYLKYAINFAASYLALWIVYSAVVVKE